jgi:acyl carrier protein
MNTSLREIVANILGVSPSEIHESSSPRDFAQWDSAAHIEIVLSVEAEYAVSFTPEEMLDVLSVEALEDALRQKGALPG